MTTARIQIVDGLATRTVALRDLDAVTLATCARFVLGTPGAGDAMGDWDLVAELREVMGDASDRALLGAYVVAHALRHRGECPVVFA